MTIAEILAALPKRKHQEALWLLGSVLKRSHSELLLSARETLADTQLRAWRRFWREREAGRPLQYIVGEAPFWGREFSAKEGVLIPRPETEILVELGLKLFSPEERVFALDIGTGSGVIGITLKLERPHWRVMLSDISARALTLAKKNSVRHGVVIETKRADLFAPKLRGEGWNLVIANPPYLDLKKDEVTAEVRRWEPSLALQPEVRQKVKGVLERAAWCAERILQGCAEARPNFSVMELSPRVALYLERRWRRHPAVERIWRAPDLAGKKRFLLVAWKAHGQI